MRMKLMVIALLLCSSVANALSFQNSVRAEFVSNRDGSWQRMKAVYNLFQGDKNACELRTLTGTIVHLNYDEQSATSITGMTLETSNGKREYISVDTEALYSLNMVEQGMIHTLIAKGKRARVDVYGCGVYGNAWNANNILAIGISNRRRNK